MPKSRKPLAVKVKDGQVTITFNAESWSHVDTQIAEFLGGDAECEDIPVAEYVSRAFKLLGHDISPPNGSWGRAIEIFEALDAAVKRAENDDSGLDDNSDLILK